MTRSCVPSAFIERSGKKDYSGSHFSALNHALNRVIHVKSCPSCQNMSKHVKSCLSCQIMSFTSNHVIHLISCQTCRIMSNHVIHVKSRHSCQITSKHVKSCHSCQIMSSHVSLRLSRPKFTLFWREEGGSNMSS
jgi:hypothetical protein